MTSAESCQREFRTTCELMAVAKAASSIPLRAHAADACGCMPATPALPPFPKVCMLLAMQCQIASPQQAARYHTDLLTRFPPPDKLCCICRPGHAAALRLGKGPQVADDVAAVWAGCLRARERVSQLLNQPGHGSDGVRMLAAKFLENTMLLLTAESSSAPKAPAAQHTLLSATLV